MDAASGTGGSRSDRKREGARARPRNGLARRDFNVALAHLAASPWLARAAAAASPARVVVLGDSLTAGYGLPADDAFPARLEAALRADGIAVDVVNAGVSGDTTAGGRARLDWALADKPDAVIVELGANDGLRGIDPAETFANLDAILRRLGDEGVKVLLAGMLAPPNLGRAYGAAFNDVYPRLAAKHGVALYPFFLDGVAARPELNQGDGLHPNARGVAVIVERIAPYVKRLLAAVQKGS
ncbi:MAG: arylesterase [Alphaproteobacteria bacterium]